MKPEEMEKAIIKNLADKTGKSLEEWYAILKKEGIVEKREMKYLLKKKYGVGHFQTQTLAGYPRCQW